MLTLWDGKNTAMFQITTGDRPKDLSAGYVSFRKYGNHYFLAEYTPSTASPGTKGLPLQRQQNVLQQLHTNGNSRKLSCPAFPLNLANVDRLPGQTEY